LKVTYAKARELIKDGDILLCSGKSGFSDIIKKVSSIGYSEKAIQYTHIGIFDWWNGRLMISEACDGQSVQHNNFSNKYIKKKYKGKLFVARVENGPVTIPYIMARIADAMSCDYSESEIVKIGLSKVLGLNVKPNNSDNSFICSELVNHAFDYYFMSKDKFCIPNDIAYSGKIIRVYEII